MWAIVLGHPGSGKNVVKDMLVKEEFEFFHNKFDCDISSPLGYEISVSMSLFKTQIQASDLMSRRNIVTVGSFWSGMEIHVPLNKEMLELSDYDYAILNKVYDGVKDGLKAPDCVIFCSASNLQASLDRITMRNQLIQQEKLSLSRELYKKFAEKIKVPLISIDATLSQENVQKDLNYGITSIKAANLSGKTIWERRMFRD